MRKIVLAAAVAGFALVAVPAQAQLFNGNGFSGSSNFSVLQNGAGVSQAFGNGSGSGFDPREDVERILANLLGNIQPTFETLIERVLGDFGFGGVSPTIPFFSF